MLQKNCRSMVLTLSSFVSILLFQNCAPQSFNALDSASAELGSQSYLPSQTGLITPSTATNTPQISSGTGASSSQGAIAPGAANNPVNNTSVNNTASSCSAYVNMLNWDPNEQYKIEIASVMNQDLNGNQIDIPAYSGFSVSFSSTRMGTHAFNATKFLVANSGFTIKLEDPESGAAEIPSSAYMDPQDTAAKMQASVSSWNHSAQQVGSRAGFFVNRDFYFSHLTNFKKSKVSLYCNNKLVASGTQDVRTLNFELNTVFTKIKDVGYTFKDPNRSAFVNISCPLEVKAGSSIQCTVSGVNLASGYWLVNGKEDRSADDNTTYTMNNVPAGNHTFQVVVKYKGGLEDRSEMFLVKAR